jgi:hypothetical protein
MKLEKPSLPVLIPQEELKAQIIEAVSEKGWKEEETSTENFVLLYVPFFVFNFEAFTESKTEESENPVVSETQNGRMALNAFDSELDEEIAGLFEEEETRLEKRTPKEQECEIQKARLTAEEAKQLAQVKMAAQLSLGKDNVIISALELIYAPFWVGAVKIAEQEYSVQANAVSGALAGLEELPARGKSYGELTKETLSELKDPFAWIKYSVSIIVDSAKWFARLPPINWLIIQAQKNKRFQIAILISILILIALKEIGHL